MIVDDYIQKEYFKKSFMAVDGLWFMKVEEEWDFETALELDRKVWEVLPKLQARKLKKIMKIKDGLEDLKKALTVKFEAEDYEYKAELNDKLKITITHCPWTEIMEKAGRKHLAGRVGDVICKTEFLAWAKEFGCTFETPSNICSETRPCTFVFKR